MATVRTAERAQPFFRAIHDPWRLAALLILVTGIALRLVHIAAPLSGDELASASIWAQMPILKIPVNYQSTNNHILSTLVLSATLKLFGLNHFLLRLPYLSFGFASLVLCYLTALRISGERVVALGAMLLLAVNSAHIIYSTAARGYILVMVFAQLALHILIILFAADNDKASPARERGLAPSVLFLLFVICLLGTWTMPTFILFEGSLLLFFLPPLLFAYRSRLLDIRFPYTQMVLILLLSLAGFFVQYFVLIPRNMLSHAFAGGGGVEGGTFFIGLILDKLVYPYGSASPVFLVIMVIGLAALYRRGRSLFFLLFCVVALIPIVIQAINLTGIVYILTGLKGINPPPRVFNYLQPIFFTLFCLGLFLALKKVYGAVATVSEVKIKALYMSIFIPLVFFAGLELIDKTFPARAAREPFPMVLRYVEQLGPNDLFLTSNRNHVWFYLYGANKMRERVRNIVDSGKLDAVFFLEYTGRDGGSDIKRILINGVEHFQFKDLSFLGNDPSDRKDLTMPANMFDLDATFANFKVYRLKARFIHKAYELKDGKDIGRWTVPAGQQVRFKEVEVEPGKRQLAIISRSSHYIIYAGNQSGGKKDAPCWNLNFICMSYPGKFGVAYFNGTVHNGSFSRKPTWVPNGWTLDHPYGMAVFQRKWRQLIFISESGDGLELMQARGFSSNATGIVRGVSSYRICTEAQGR